LSSLAFSKLISVSLSAGEFLTAVRVATAASRYDRYQPEHHAFEDARHRPEPEPHRKLHDLGLSAQNSNPKRL
jgi:hypothetical protein